MVLFCNQWILKGKTVSHTAMNVCLGLVPTSIELSGFIALLLLSTQSVVNGQESFTFSCRFYGIPNFQKSWKSKHSVYQTLFFLPTHKSMGARLQLGLSSNVYDYMYKCDEVV